MHQRLPLITVEILRGSKCLYCLSRVTFIQCHILQKCIKSAFLFTDLCSFVFLQTLHYNIFSHLHNNFALSFFNSKGVKYDSISKVVSDNPSYKTLV